MRDVEQGAGRRLRLAAAIAAAAALGLVSAPAAGASPLKTRSGSTTIIGQGMIGTAKATCPKRTRVVAGGYSSTKPAANATPSNLLDVYESRRANARTWQVSAGQLAGGPSRLTAYAYCRAGSVREVVNTVPLAAAARSEAIAIATCPRGTRAVSGGFQVPATIPGAGTPPDPVFSYVTEQALAGVRVWKVTGVRSGSDVPAAGTVSAYAYCAPVHKPGLEGKTTTATTPTTAGVDVVPTVQTDPCRKRTTAVSGGFRAPYAQSGATRESTFVTQSNRVGRGWAISGEAFGKTGLTLSLTSLAYCR